MKLAQRIYCIEGHWDYGAREVEPSVEPILQLLRDLGHWDHYVHRDCVTVDELRYFLDKEWKRCKEGSILYIATHGAPGAIWLSESENEVITLEVLSEMQYDFTNCLVHFGGCSILGDDGKARARKFMQATGANYVSGYTKDTGWVDISDPPALALEVMFFSSIKAKKIDLTKSRANSIAKREMQELRGELRGMFKTCGFELLT